MKNFIQRAITGLIFVAVLIGCMIGGPLSSEYYSASSAPWLRLSSVT